MLCTAYINISVQRMNFSGAKLITKWIFYVCFLLGLKPCSINHISSFRRMNEGCSCLNILDYLLSVEKARAAFSLQMAPAVITATATTTGTASSAAATATAAPTNY